ncbi:MAG: Fur family transcriptional regulator [Nitrososphaerota archaeon]
MEAKLISQLRERKLKVTPQRVLILKILNRGGHYTGEQVYNLIKKEIPGISISTVYNTLDTLHSKGLLNSFEVNGMKWYEAETRSHVNVYCTNSKEIIDIDLDFSQIERALKSKGLNPTKISIIAYSECEKQGN